MRQMDEMTQHNAALVEETNAAIEQTEAQATELDRIVDVFTHRRRRGARSRLAPSAASARTAAARHQGLQDGFADAAKSYLTQGNAAVEDRTGKSSEAGKA